MGVKHKSSDDTGTWRGFEDIPTLARALRAGRRKSRDLVARSLDRAATDRARFRAVIALNPDAMATSNALDAEGGAGQWRGVLHGLPVMVKDNLDTADAMATTAGSLALVKTHADADAAVVARLRDAGAVIVGKTNLSEWANFRSTTSSSGWSSVGGQTRNAYDERRSPGGSSSGSAVAVARGQCVAAVGTETDGSVVLPAAMNGVVGIKPTLGLVSRRGIVPITMSQDTAGAMARSVNDAACLLACMAGPDDGDSASRPPPWPVESLASIAARDDLAGLRIGVVRDYTGYSEATDQVFETALEHLRSLGATIVDPVPLTPRETLAVPEAVVMRTEFKAALAAYLATRSADTPVRSVSDVIAFNRRHAATVMPYFGQDRMLAAEASGALDEPDYLGAHAEAFRLAATDGIDAALDGASVDLLVAPTTSPAWLIDPVNGDNRKGGCSGPAAVAGYPHITVPMGRVQHLPVGLSLFASAWAEPLLIGVAASFEQLLTASRSE